MEYKTIMWPDFDKFNDRVNLHLATDWKLVGGVSVVREPDVEGQLIFAQAVVRKRKTPYIDPNIEQDNVEIVSSGLQGAAISFMLSLDESNGDTDTYSKYTTGLDYTQQDGE